MYNVIVYNFPESSVTFSVVRISNNTKLLFEYIQLFSTSLSTNTKHFKLGRSNVEGPRPLKVILSSKKSAIKIISDYNIGTKSWSSSEIVIPIFISRNCTAVAAPKAGHGTP